MFQYNVLTCDYSENRLSSPIELEFSMRYNSYTAGWVELSYSDSPAGGNGGGFSPIMLILNGKSGGPNFSFPRSSSRPHSLLNLTACRLTSIQEASHC